MNIFDMGFFRCRRIFEGNQTSGRNQERRRPDLPPKADLSPTLTIERPHKADWRGFQGVGKGVLALNPKGASHSPAPGRRKKQSRVPPVCPARGLGATASSQPVGFNRLIYTTAVPYRSSVPGDERLADLELIATVATAPVFIQTL